jgi:AraC-like DNA-binding protein/mannose-6-phosphate isomerase-like protein (cupin superfamily)
MFLHRMTKQLQQESFPCVEACYSWTWTDFHMAPHAHDRAEIMYLLRGRCRIQLFEGDRQQEFTMGVGEFVLIDAGMMHALQVDESCYMVNVEFSFRPNPPLMTMQSLMAASPALAQWLRELSPWQRGKDDSGMLYAALSAVVDDYFHAADVDTALKEIHIAQMLVHLATALMDDKAAGKGYVYVRRCVNLLSERMSEDARIEELAGELGISAAYLQRLFRQVHGMTIIDYLNRMRIERAKLLLLNTDDPVVEIAMEAGFNSRQHFTRVFTSLEGISPQEYRREKRNSEEKQIFLF